MVSIGFDAVTGLSGLGFTLKGVVPGKVHRVTRGATTRSDLYMLQVALSQSFYFFYPNFRKVLRNSRSFFA